MNIFVLHKSPIVSAIVLARVDPRRGRKIFLECVQMMATAIRLRGIDLEAMPITKAGNYYRMTHANHPVCKWVRECSDNFRWTWTYAATLGEMLGLNGDNTNRLWKATGQFPRKASSGFTNCTPYKDAPSVYEAYEAHLMEKWHNDEVSI